MTRFHLCSRLLHRIALVAPGGFSLRPAFHRLRGATLGRQVWISLGVYIDEWHPEVVTIGDNSTIGLRTSIFTHLQGSIRPSAGFKPVHIGREVFVGPHCVILPGVRIGDGSVIKAGTVVTRNVPPGTLWGTTGAAGIARVTIPFANGCSFQDFVYGLRPLSRNSIDQCHSFAERRFRVPQQENASS
jgi:carbonic anhydrase/acetyltransferase-like protein (isoleucine patch superfamily)